MNIFSRSLSHKIIIWVCGLLCLSGFIGFLGGNQYYHQVLKPKNDAKITHMAREIKAFYLTLPDDQRGPYLKSIAASGYDLAVYTDKKPRYYGSPFRVKTLSPTALNTVISGQTYHGLKHYNKGPLVTGFFANDVNNTIGIPLTKQQQLFIRANPNLQFGELRAYLTIIALITAILGAFLLVLTAQHRLVLPIKRLTRATKQVASGQYDLTLSDSRSDEIGQLTQSFKTMAQQLAQVEKSRNEFVANISHDLQSPLTAMQGYAQQLADAALTDQQRSHYLEIIQSETGRLAQLTKELLLLSALDQSQQPDFQQRIDLKQQLKSVISTFAYQLDKKSLFVQTQLKDVTILGNQDMLFQVWQNLLTNSIHYAPANSDIEIELVQKSALAMVTFTNHGPVIPAHQLDHLFERFYQASNVRQERAHHGLGLAIAQKIVQMHQGQITAASSTKQGTTFTVTLPSDHLLSK